MLLSYAQRLEDWHLHHVLGPQPSGFYVDIGGGHPIVDNVSYFFYLRGWRGLIVEPQQPLARLYPGTRPRDTVLSCLVGAKDGEADFHIIDRLHGFSTTVESNARNASAYGAGYETSRLPMRRLASILGEHEHPSIDFLKIDVEGAEADVLAGNDWTRFRPRIVVVEAVAPGSMAETWSEWERQLVDAGYSFAFFDGLNRFYVAAECSELIARFPAEPLAWDSIRHLYEFGRADERPDHPDHELSRRLIKGFLAELPMIDPAFLRRLLGRTSTKEQEDVAVDVQTDEFRAALGRIASGYDGGFIE